MRKMITMVSVLRLPLLFTIAVHQQFSFPLKSL